MQALPAILIDALVDLGNFNFLKFLPFHGIAEDLHTQSSAQFVSL